MIWRTSLLPRIGRYVGKSAGASPDRHWAQPSAPLELPDLTDSPAHPLGEPPSAGVRLVAQHSSPVHDDGVGGRRGPLGVDGHHKPLTVGGHRVVVEGNATPKSRSPVGPRTVVWPGRRHEWRLPSESRTRVTAHACRHCAATFSSSSPIQLRTTTIPFVAEAGAPASSLIMRNRCPSGATS